MQGLGCHAACPSHLSIPSRMVLIMVLGIRSLVEMLPGLPTESLVKYLCFICEINRWFEYLRHTRLFLKEYQTLAVVLARHHSLASHCGPPLGAYPPHAAKCPWCMQLLVRPVFLLVAIDHQF